MPTTLPPEAAALTIAVYLGVLVLPGLLVGLAAGLRGWLLAAATPLLTFSVAGISGQWMGWFELPFGFLGFAISTLLFATVAAGTRAVRGRALAPADPPLWTRTGHLAVGACWAFAAGVGAYTVLRGMGDLNAIPQGWDAAFHANGIRYLDETGDSSVTGMSKVAWYAPGEQIFYPNAYHLLGVLVWQLAGPWAGAPIAAILNANAVLMPATLGLSLVAMVRQFAGRAVLAGMTPVVTVAATMVFYENMMGPILPYAQGLVLLPVVAALLHRHLQLPTQTSGLLLGIAVAGMLTVHASMLFSGVLFLLPYLVSRWSTGTDRLRRWGRELRSLLSPVLVVAVLSAPTTIGALVLVTGDYPYRGWPWKQPLPEALESWLVFAGQTVTPQLWLTAACAVGAVLFWRLDRLRWLLGSALLLGVCFVVTSTWDNEVVKQLSRPWWNNPYRLVSLAGLAMCVLAAHGLAEIQAALRGLVRRWVTAVRVRRLAAAGIAAAVLGSWAVASGLYVTTNSTLIGLTVGRHPERDPHNLPISRDEAVAMLRLGELAEPGDWVLNERSDGTAWTYALTGLRPVAGHFDPYMNPPDADVLADRFRDYPTDPQVRELVERMNVRWVIVGRGGYPRYADGSDRAPGLRDLDGLPFLRLAYRNADASVYRIVG